MAKYSMKMGGKEVGPASVYAEPHTMTGKKLPIKEAGTMPVKEALKKNISVAYERSNEYPGVKTSGIKIRGTGAATKGVMARGPMA
jgi:hypothetical protein